MLHILSPQAFLKPAALSLSLFLLIPAAAQQGGGDGEKSKPMIRFICVASLEEKQQAVLAAKNEEGEWQELGEVGLRSSFITDWLPAKAGELHLTLREGDTLKSIGSFDYPVGSRRVLAVLLPDTKNQKYRAMILDPEKNRFEKGSVLIVNFSNSNGLVMLGSRREIIRPGQKTVAKPALEDNGMYRLLVVQEDAEKKAVPCYDRYIPGNPDSRDMLFLFPDKTLGLKAFSLPMFGSLD